MVWFKDVRYKPPEAASGCCLSPETQGSVECILNAGETVTLDVSSPQEQFDTNRMGIKCRETD